MMTWNDLARQLRTRFRLSGETATSGELLWSFGGRLQEQRLELGHARTGPHVLLSSDVAGSGSVAPRRALEHNATLAAGALAIQGQRVILRHILALEGLSFTRLSRDMELCAHEAARLRGRVESPFGGYSE